MALKGKYKIGHYAPGEPVEVEITIPMEFSDESHPDYQLRGQTIKRLESHNEFVVDTIIENCYIVIKAIAIHLEDVLYQPEEIEETYGKKYRVNVMYYIFLDQNDRKLDFNAFHMMEDASEMIYLDSLEQLMPNPIAWAYNYVKTLPSFNEVIDA